MADTISLASWSSISGSEAATPVRQRSFSSIDSSPRSTGSIAVSDSAIGLEDGLEITAANAHEWLCYQPQYKVLVCRYHQYAVRNLATHLRLQHKVRSPERAAVEGAFRAYELLDPADVATPPPLKAPLDWLGTPVRAYYCDEPGCGKLTTSRDEIRKHCYKTHSWRSTAEDPEHWHGVYVQTIFQSKAHRRYFVVDYQDECRERAEETDRVSPSSQRILEQWDRQLEKQEQHRQLAEAEISKTDHTLWFKRNRWPEVLGRSNLRHLSRASRMPQRDEEVLKAVPQTMETLIEECVKGLPTLGHVIRRWLRSAKASEPDVRPLARLQNEESQKRYAGYMTRFLCYTLRVWKSCEEVGAETVPSGGEEEETEDEDVLRSSPRQASQESGVIVVDTMKDARRLYPWQSGLREIVARLWRALSPSGSLESPQHVILEFFRHVLFQHIRVNVFESSLIHFLAVLGIDEDTCRLREGNDFSYMLAGLVYCSRVLGVEIILPKMLRKTETQEDDDRFLSLRLKHLADGSFSPMAEMISLLAYSRHCAFNHANAGAISWSPDNSVIAYRGQKIPLARFKRLIDTVITEAENILWRELLWQTDSSRFALVVDQLEDDVTFTRRGFSFLDHTRNGLKDTRAWVLAQMEAHGEGRKLRQGERWHRRRVRKYLRRVDHFRELLLLCVHWTGGQPARGTEITSIRFRNGYMQDRNVFAIHGHLAVVTRYHKSASQFDQPKVVPRFLAWRVGQLLAVYLAYAQPLGELLADAVNGQVAGEYVWAGEHGPWETDRLTRVIKRETGRHLGIELTTHSYRHVAIAIGRKVIGEQFANGYRGEVDGVEDEPEEETEDSLEMQAGRGAEVGAKRYGVSMDIIKNLSSRSIDTFRPLCQQWHRFLGLESSKALGGCAASRVAPHGIKRKWDMDMDAAGADVLGALKRLKHCSGRTDMAAGVARGESQSVGRGDSQPQAGVERSGEENPFIAAMRKALRKDEVSFRSEAQKEALTAIVKGGRSPLVVVIPTGGGKSLLFTAPACLVDAGMTIVVVPFRALINDLVDKAKEAGIDSIEWRPGEVNPATLVFVSADLVDGTGFLGYAQQLLDSGWLRRIFVDECHLIFKDGHWRSKLARLGTLRRVNCEMILLTATLPPIMQGELEYCMAMEMCRYIRADTTRLRTRYMVEECKAGALESRAVDICRSWAQAHPSAKGVVYCRGRKQCERLAAELGGVFYHSEADGKEERIEHWLKCGGLIVATSALGTGVDFPGITLVLHVDIPWSMIDFAQESGRAGRQGEDADSVIVYEEGQTERIRHKMQSADERAMLDFISTHSCRRRVQSRFLDGIERDCVSDERGLAYCDGCGEGWTALERRQRQDCEKRAVVERVLSELVDDCPVCWVEGRVSCQIRWDTLPDGYGRWKADKCWSRKMHIAERFDIVFEADTHSCFTCLLSQKLCRTGQSTTAECQWPEVASPILQMIRYMGRGRGILRRWNYPEAEREEESWEKYRAWLGRRHPRRVLGEVVSNGFALLVEFIWEEERERQGKESGEESEEVASAVDEGEGFQLLSEWPDDIAAGLGRVRESKSGRVEEVVRLWEEGCIVCRAKGRGRQRHAWLECRHDIDDTEAVHQGVQMLLSIQAPFRRGGYRCWAGGDSCRCGEEQRRGGCAGGTTVRLAVAALLFVGGEAVREWVEGQEAFRRAVEGGKDGRGALEALLSTKSDFDGGQQVGVDAMLLRWGSTGR